MENNIKEFLNDIEEIDCKLFVEIFESCFNNYYLRWDNELNKELNKYTGLNNDNEDLMNRYFESDIYDVIDCKYFEYFKSIGIDCSYNYITEWGYEVDKDKLYEHLYNNIFDDSICEIFGSITGECISGYAHQWFILDLHRELYSEVALD